MRRKKSRIRPVVSTLKFVREQRHSSYQTDIPNGVSAIASGPTKLSLSSGAWLTKTSHFWIAGAFARVEARQKRS